LNLHLTKIFSQHFYLAIIAAWLFTFSFLFSDSNDESKLKIRVKNKIENELHKKESIVKEFLQDTAQLQSIVLGNISREVNNKLINSSVHFFVYKTNINGIPQLIYWNQNKVLANDADLGKNNGSYFIQSSSGQFELIKSTLFINNELLIVICYLPIKWEYFIENKYLQKQFDGIKKIEKNIEVVEKNNTGFGIINSNQVEICKIKFPVNNWKPSENFAVIILRIISLVFVFLFIHFVAVKIINNGKVIRGFTFLITTIIFLRILSYYFDFPFSSRNLELFDPSIYASNFMHPSLGDLFINSLLITWVVFFIIKYSEIISLSGSKNKVVKILTANGLIAFAVVIFFTIAEIIKSLIKDSKISFDVTNFFKLNIYSLIGIIIICLLLIIAFECFNYLIKLSKKFSKLTVLNLLALIILTSILTVLCFDNFVIKWSYSYYIIWIAIIILLIYFNNVETSFLFVRGQIILWVLVLAISLTTFMQYLNSVVEIAQRKQIAEKISLQTDPAGENLMSIAITNFNTAFFVNNINRLQQEYSNKFIKDSLLNENFSGYLNKYDSRIYTYNGLGKPLFNDDTLSLNSILNIISNKSRETSFAGLYYYENTFDKYSYVFENAIIHNDSLLGYYFVIAKPKQYKSEALYPELFKQSKDIHSDLNIDYSFAVYKNNLLIHTSNDYPFSSTLDYTVASEFFTRIKNNYSELFYNAENNKIVIVAKKNQNFIAYLTLLGYLVCTIMLFLALFKISVNLNFKELKKFNVSKIFNLNIRNQIQLTITLVSVIAFIVIGIVTISFYINRFNRSNEERLKKTIQVVGAEIENHINTSLAFDDVLTVNELVLVGDLEKKINEVSEVHNVDINLFDLNGALKVSTQPYIYNKQILSSQLHPIAYSELNHQNSNQFIQEENIGKFKFLSIYIPLTNQQGKVFSYLNIPYLKSQTELNQEISNFLVALINLNALIFLIAGFIAFWLTNRITQSFSFIGNKMREINLGQKNEEIFWNRNDELGMLFSEYNKMVKKLEISAEILAKKEREGAWREMARQVAHEIKNPLTPMKLSIQYLQKAVDENAPNVKELSKQVAGTFIEQIDQLSKIASDFSQFANIGMVHAENLNIVEVIQSVITLFQTNKRVNFSWIKNEDEYFVNADKIQMNRLFTNLIQNAIQSVAPDKNVEIKIQITSENKYIIIAIQDNGQGIHKELQPKIFLPNFTTKSSGTGLGLAICKGIVEKANAEIWFETSKNIGTTFFVKIPQVSN
jgi:two-component system nitrogen regulation sensor histidine kinase NtrY